MGSPLLLFKNNLSPVRPSENGEDGKLDALQSSRNYIRMWRLWGHSHVRAKRLLRILFIWLCPLPSKSGRSEQFTPTKKWLV